MTRKESKLKPMKTFRAFFYYIPIMLALTTGVQAQTNVFEHYFKTAEAVSHAYPQEKAYLHFDNTSYYQGDTIWFKANLVNVADNSPSQISKPLYVELLDQLGNRIDRKIIKMDNGQGCGYFALKDAFFTGYYEIRAYTRWMLAFDNASYFTRVLPVFRKIVGTADKSRSIAKYRSLDKSMKQRPKEQEDKFIVKFYPEGGNLVKGLTSTVAFEATAKDSGTVNVSGFLRNCTGQRICPMQALHDGRGIFTYTPDGNPSEAVFKYDGKEYTFKLPEALERGYVIQAVNRGENIDITLKRSSDDMTDSLAVFLFSRGIPVSYSQADFKGGRECHFKFPTAYIPDGVACFTLINAAGKVLAERFCFIRPKQKLDLKAVTDKPVYSPYEHISCKVKLADSDGKPVKNASVSLSILDGIESDFKEYDNNIMTDLLLTSELRGYIDRPGFYFRDDSPGTRMLLDQLMLVRGWRRYDMAALLGQKTPQPRYMPEQELILSGRVNTQLNKPQPNIGVSIMALNDSTFMAGNTVADENGFFSIPLEGFKDETETVIQTRRQGKRLNKWSRISLFRNFGPEPRAYAYREINPIWKQHPDLALIFHSSDSASTSLQTDDSKHLAEIYITAKRRQSNGLKSTEEFEREIIGYYNIRDFINRELDDGKSLFDLYDVLHDLNHNIVKADSGRLHYGAAKLSFYVDSQNIEFADLNDEYMKMQTMMLYKDQGSKFISNIDPNTFRRKQVEARDFWTGFELNKEEYSVIASIKMDYDWDIEKKNRPRRGMRITTVLGYETPREFYSPAYNGNTMPVYTDKRRTLYWNPSVITDDNGEATVSCFNNSTSKQVVVVAETINNGKTGVSFYEPVNK